MPRPDVTPPRIHFNHPADFDLSHRPHFRALEAFAAHYHYCMGGTPLPTSIAPLPPAPSPLPPNPTVSQLTRYRRQLSRLTNSANSQLLLIKPSSLASTSIPSSSELFRRFASAIRASGRRMSVTDPSHPSIIPSTNFSTPYLTLLAPAYRPRSAPNLLLGPYALHLNILKSSLSGPAFNYYFELLDRSNMAACGSIWTNSSATFRTPLPTRLLATTMCLGDAQYALIPEAIRQGNILNALDAFLSVIDGYNPRDNSQRLSCWHIPSSTRLSCGTGTDPLTPFEAPCPPPHLTLPSAPHWNISDPVPSLNLRSFALHLTSLLPILASHIPPYLPPPTSLLPPAILNRDGPRASGWSSDQHFFDRHIATYDYNYRFYDLGRRRTPSAYFSPSHTVMQFCYFDRYFHPSPVPSFRHLQLPTRTTRFPSTPPHTLPSTLTFICSRCSNIRPLHEHSRRIPSCCLSCQSLPVPPLPRPTPPLPTATIQTLRPVEAEPSAVSEPQPEPQPYPTPSPNRTLHTPTPSNPVVINAYFDASAVERSTYFEATTYTSANAPASTAVDRVIQTLRDMREAELRAATSTTTPHHLDPNDDLPDQPF